MANRGGAVLWVPTGEGGVVGAASSQSQSSGSLRPVLQQGPNPSQDSTGKELAVFRLPLCLESIGSDPKSKETWRRREVRESFRSPPVVGQAFPQPKLLIKINMHSRNNKVGEKINKYIFF